MKKLQVSLVIFVVVTFVTLSYFYSLVSYYDGRREVINQVVQAQQECQALNLELQKFSVAKDCSGYGDLIAKLN